MRIEDVEIYTDGACRRNPGPGGWGAVLVAGEGGRHERCISGGEPATTNNRMELRAVIEALETLKYPCRAVLHTDSQYVRKGITEWIGGWKANGWRTSAGKAVKNQDLWERLDAAVGRHLNVDFKWVKGHAGNPGNEKADRLAAEAAREV